MAKIVIYAEWLDAVGGIETFTQVLCKLFSRKGYEVDLVCKGWRSDLRIFKYGEEADLYRWNPKEMYEGDLLIIASNHAKPENVKGKYSLQVIHSDYEKYKLRLVGNKVNDYIAVSQHASNIARKLFKINPIVIYNIVDPDFCNNVDTRKPIKFITNSRISREKGFERMFKMCQMLKVADIPFEWTINGENSVDKDYQNTIINMFKEFPEVRFNGYVPEDKIAQYNKGKDYLVQLSDFEGCPYTVLEGLAMKIPVILTDFPSAFELVEDGKSGYIVPMDMNFDIKKLLKIPKLKESLSLASIEEWERFIK